MKALVRCTYKIQTCLASLGAACMLPVLALLNGFPRSAFLPFRHNELNDTGLWTLRMFNGAVRFAGNWGVGLDLV